MWKAEAASRMKIMRVRAGSWCVTCLAPSAGLKSWSTVFPSRSPSRAFPFFSLFFPFHGPSPIVPCNFQQKLLAIANLLQAYDCAEEYSCRRVPFISHPT
jgi:hypothetical protein